MQCFLPPIVTGSLRIHLHVERLHSYPHPCLWGLHPPPWGCNTSGALLSWSWSLCSSPSSLVPVSLFTLLLCDCRATSGTSILAYASSFAVTSTSRAYNSLLHLLYLTRSSLKLKVYFNAKIPTAQSVLTLRLGQPSCLSFQPCCFSVKGCFFTSRNQSAGRGSGCVSVCSLLSAMGTDRFAKAFILRCFWIIVFKFAIILILYREKLTYLTKGLS